MSAEERSIAEDIVRVLTRDAAIRVRQALAEQLKESRSVPHDVAVALANDVDSVSLPMLTHSLVLSDDDLIEIVRCSGAAKQAAIARREHVSSSVAEAIVAADEPSAVATLVANEGAVLKEKTLQQLLDRHAGDELISAPMASRANLPVTVLERLVTAASAGIREMLARRNDLPSHLASDLVLNTRERATGAYCRPVRRRPTPCIWRSICSAPAASRPRSSSAPSASAISLSSRRPLPCWRKSPPHNARPAHLRRQPEPASGQSTIGSRLPAEFFELFRIGMQVAQQTDFDGGENDRERHRRRTLERILTQFEEIGAR